jgi:sugar-specific transcriptional regulator TrmB
MATDITDKVIEKLRGLPESRQAEVLKYVEKLASDEVDRENGHGQPAIWDKIQTIMRDVPDEVLATIPTDGSINVDHYLYGAPKK